MLHWHLRGGDDNQRQTAEDNRKATTDQNQHYHHIKTKFFSGWDKHHNFSSYQAGMSCCSEEFPCNTSCGGHNAQSCAACPQVIWLSSVLQILSFALDLMLMLKFLGLCLWKFILPFTSGSWCEVVQWRLWLEGWQMPATCWYFRCFNCFFTFLYDEPLSNLLHPSKSIRPQLLRRDRVLWQRGRPHRCKIWRLCQHNGVWQDLSGFSSFLGNLPTCCLLLGLGWYLSSLPQLQKLTNGRKQLPQPVRTLWGPLVRKTDNKGAAQIAQKVNLEL